MTRNGILPNLHVHNVADERPIPDIITNFAKATAGASGRNDQEQHVRGNASPPDLVQTGTKERYL